LRPASFIPQKKRNRVADNRPVFAFFKEPQKTATTTPARPTRAAPRVVYLF
jgi:hypothetical protein